MRKVRFAKNMCVSQSHVYLDCAKSKKFARESQNKFVIIKLLTAEKQIQNLYD